MSAPVGIPSSSRRSMPSSKRRLAQGISFVLALGLLAWLLDRIGWTRIGEAFSRIGVTGALLLVALGVTDLVLDGVALWFAVGRRGGARVVTSNALGALINQVIPFEAGEAVKAGLLRSRIGTRSAFSGIIFWNYLFKLSRPLVAIMAALVGWFGVSGLPDGVGHLLVLAALVALIPFLVMRIVLRQGAAALVVRVAGRLRVLGRRASAFLDTARQIDAELHRIRRERRRDYLAVLLLQMASRTTSWLFVWLVAHLLGHPWSFSRAAAVYAALILTDYLAMVMPARVGVMEGAAFGLFKLLSLDPSLGVLMTILNRLKSLVASALVGLPALAGAPPLRQVVEAGTVTAPPPAPELTEQPPTHLSPERQPERRIGSAGGAG
jgi:hypothetical protein